MFKKIKPLIVCTLFSLFFLFIPILFNRAFAGNRYEGRDIKIVTPGQRTPYLLEMYIRGRVQTIRGFFYAISSSKRVLAYTLGR